MSESEMTWWPASEDPSIAKTWQADLEEVLSVRLELPAGFRSISQ